MARILIAEDEPDIRQLVAFTLQFKGHEVLTAGDGQAALDACRAAAPDMILMDVRMPRMDGREACRQIKKLPGLEGVPVVFLSAKGQSNEIQAGYEAGAAEYLLKPFSIQELTERVQAILERSATA